MVDSFPKRDEGRSQGVGLDQGGQVVVGFAGDLVRLLDEQVEEAAEFPFRNGSGGLVEQFFPEHLGRGAEAGESGHLGADVAAGEEIF